MLLCALLLGAGCLGLGPAALETGQTGLAAGGPEEGGVARLQLLRHGAVRIGGVRQDAHALAQGGEAAEGPPPAAPSPPA